MSIGTGHSRMAMPTSTDKHDPPYKRLCPIDNKPVYYGIYCNGCHYSGRVDEEYEKQKKEKK